MTVNNTRLGEPQRLVVRRVEVLEEVSAKLRDQRSLTYLGVGDEVVGVGAVEVESDKVVPAVTGAGGDPVLTALAERQAELQTGLQAVRELNYPMRDAESSRANPCGLTSIHWLPPRATAGEPIRILEGTWAVHCWCSVAAVDASMAEPPTEAAWSAGKGQHGESELGVK